MSIEHYEHDGFNSASEIDQARNSSIFRHINPESKKSIPEFDGLSQKQPDLRHRLTHAEAVDRAQLLALFDRSDARGQLLLLQIAAIHADRYPKA